ncbi:MAG: SMP-30/gluconolactonase/LRE family protein [Acidobacteriota bacterium]
MRVKHLLLLLALAMLAAPLWANQAETLVLFDPTVPENPESIVFDRFDNAYVTLALNGAVVRISRHFAVTHLASLPIDAPCATPAVALGLAIDWRGRLFAAVVSCNPANTGIWRINKFTGALTQVANLPSFAVPNGIDVDNRGSLYAGDTFAGLVWRVDLRDGSYEVWKDDPLLEIAPGSPFPGPNGVEVYKGEVYVANSSTGDIIAIPIDRPSGTAGDARVAFSLPEPQGCDEFVFDIKGSVYCTTDPFNTVVRLDPDGTTEILLTADDLLDGPTSAAFGRRGQNRKSLYITNAAFPQFTTTFRPSLMRIRLDTPGAPLIQ